MHYYCRVLNDDEVPLEDLKSTWEKYSRFEFAFQIRQVRIFICKFGKFVAKLKCIPTMYDDQAL